MYLRSSLSWTVLALAIQALGCSDNSSQSDTSDSTFTVDHATLTERLSLLETDMTIGASGKDVHAVHEYLMGYGYFPNADLAREHPTWRSVVNDTPADWSRYDAVTAKAMGDFQRRSGIAPSGIVDEPTRTALRSPRCGDPDSAPVDPSEKFYIAHTGRFAPNAEVIWRVQDVSGLRNNITAANVRAAVQAATATWQAQSSLTFREATSINETARFQIFSSDTVTVAGTSEAGSTIFLGKSSKFSAASTTPADAYDLQWVVLHEIGHVLGLGHSMVDVVSIRNSPVMYYDAAYGYAKRALHVDDKVAYSSLYDTWTQVAGSAWDIGVGSAAGTQNVWIIGDTPTADGNGYVIQKYNGTGWTTASGGRGAVRISVSLSGVAVIVDNKGNAFYRNSFGGWTQYPGCATDIAASSPLWKLSCTPTSGGNYTAEKWDGAKWVVNPYGSGVKIATNSSGYVYLINAAGVIYRSNTAQDVNTTWTTMNDTGHDMGISTSNHLFVADSSGLWLWNQQIASTRGSPTYPAVADWRGANNMAIWAVAPDPEGNPWIVDWGGGIWKTVK